MRHMALKRNIIQCQYTYHFIKYIVLAPALIIFPTKQSAVSHHHQSTVIRINESFTDFGITAERPQLNVPNGFSHPMEFAVMKIMTEFPDLELKLLRVTATNDIVMTVECGDTFNGFTKEQWIGLRNEFRRYFGLIRFLDTRCRNGMKSHRGVTVVWWCNDTIPSQKEYHRIFAPEQTIVIFIDSHFSIELSINLHSLSNKKKTKSMVGIKVNKHRGWWQPLSLRSWWLEPSWQCCLLSGRLAANTHLAMPREILEESIIDMSMEVILHTEHLKMSQMSCKNTDSFHVQRYEWIQVIWLSISIAYNDIFMISIGLGSKVLDFTDCWFTDALYRLYRLFDYLLITDVSILLTDSSSMSQRIGEMVK